MSAIGWFRNNCSVPTGLYQGRCSHDSWTICSSGLSESLRGRIAARKLAGLELRYRRLLLVFLLVPAQFGGISGGMRAGMLPDTGGPACSQA